MKKKNMLTRVFVYLLGFTLMTMGIAISRRSGLGVSPVSTIPYTITGITLIDISITTVIFHVALIIIQILILRKDFKIKNFLQIPAGIIFGILTGLFQQATNMVVPDPAIFGGVTAYIVAIIMCLISTVLVAIGIFFYVPADIIPLAGEGAMLAISQKTGIKFSTVKIAFDITMVVTSFVACAIFKGGIVQGFNMQIIGVGTIIAAVLVGVNLKWITALIGKYRDKLLSIGTSADTEVTNDLTEIMKKDIYSLDESTSLGKALEYMVERKISGAPVVDNKGNLTGFISDGDILRYLSAEHSLFVLNSDIHKVAFNDKIKTLALKKVKDIATKQVITVDVHSTLDDVCTVFIEHSLKKAPVIHHGKMVGVINASNITKFVLRQMKQSFESA